MSGGKISYPNIYCLYDTQKKIYEIHECEHKTAETVFLVNKNIERNLKEMKYIIFKSAR